MSRQSLICRMGLEDNAAIELLAPDSTTTVLSLTEQTERFGHGIGRTLENVLAAGLTPSETAFDLLLLAASVYRCDTRVSREIESQDNWTREIDIYLPVHDPQNWQRISNLLAETFQFLTGDRWNFIFRPRPAGFEQAMNSPAARVEEPPTSACLFSGGLDSFIGAIDLLQEGTNVLFVSHSSPWDSGTNKYQKLSVDALKAAYPMRSVKSDVGFHKHDESDQSENTERSRSLLFFAVAVLAASGMRQPNALIHVPENGLMSLNVPLDPLRLGALSTRTTHPFYMAKFNEILVALGISVHLANPYQFKTKGEMVVESRNQDLLLAHASTTMSCASPKKYRTRGVPYGHCGHCFPCIIRRASLLNFNDPTNYFTDLRARPLVSTTAEGESVRSCQVAISRLNNDLRRARVLIHKPGPLGSRPADLEAYAGTYLRGMQEIARLLEGVQTVSYALSSD